MTPDDVYKHYKSYYRFNQLTGMSACSLRNWRLWGYVPEGSQCKIERLTEHALKTEWTKDNLIVEKGK